MLITKQSKSDRIQSKTMVEWAQRPPSRGVIKQLDMNHLRRPIPANCFEHHLFQLQGELTDTKCHLYDNAITSRGCSVSAWLNAIKARPGGQSRDLPAGTGKVRVLQSGFLNRRSSRLFSHSCETPSFAAKCVFQV